MTPHRSHVRLAVALVACCALGLAFVATALAKHSHSELSGAQSPAAEAGGSETGASAPSEADAGEAAGEPAASAPTSSQGAGTASGDAQAGAASGKSDSASTQRAAGAQAAHRKEATKSKRSHETALKGAGASKASSGSEGAGEGEAAGTSTTVASEVVVPTAAAASAGGSIGGASASASSAPAATSAPAADSRTLSVSTTTSRARHARGSSRPASARHRTAVAAAAGLDSLALPAALSAQASSSSSRPAAGAGDARSRAHAAERQRRPSPLVTTITRIVDVVPLAMRELLAALLALALLLGMRSRLTALRARRLERQRAQLLEDVGLLQAALLPDAPARLGLVGTSVAYRPADGPGAGGDFYDVFALADGRLAVIVGDVSGHGRQALPHTALVRFTLRAYLEAGLSPRDALQTAGAVLERQLGGAFATVVVATYQPRERVLVYACAGHPPPIVLGGVGVGVGGVSPASNDEAGAGAGVASRALAPVTACGAPPIGVGMRTGTRQTAVSIPGRALICFHTDGLTEARIGSELFGAERLLDTLAELAPDDATASALLARVAERADAHPDDMAACVLSVEGGELAPAVLAEELELDGEHAEAARAERFLLACGVEHDDLDEAASTVRAAAARAGTAVLVVRRAGGAVHEVTVQRDRLAHLSARRAKVAVAS